MVTNLALIRFTMFPTVGQTRSKHVDFLTTRKERVIFPAPQSEDGDNSIPAYAVYPDEIMRQIENHM